jgi:hypothetical protein
VIGAKQKADRQGIRLCRVDGSEFVGHGLIVALSCDDWAPFALLEFLERGFHEHELSSISRELPLGKVSCRHFRQACGFSQLLVGPSPHANFVGRQLS